MSGSKLIGVIGQDHATISVFLQNQLPQSLSRICQIDDPANPQPLQIAFESFDAQKLAEYDLLIFIFSAIDGVTGDQTELWANLDEWGTPRMVLVTDLEKTNEVDFEDAVPIIGRMLGPVIARFLIVYGDESEIAALIDIDNLTINNYQTNPPAKQEADNELKNLVLEFRQELFDKYEEHGEDGFSSGIAFPAIPFSPEINCLGIEEVALYINQLM